MRVARIRSKLGLLLLIPLIAVMVLAAIRLVDGAQRADSVSLLRSLAVVSAEASEVSHELHRERMAAARLLTDPERDTGPFNWQTVRTDDAMAHYQQARNDLDDVPATIEERLTQIDEQLATVSAVRQDILREGDVTLSAAALRYGVILGDIVDYQEAVGQVAGDVELAESIRAVAALSKVRLHMAEAQSVAYLDLVDQRLDDAGLTGFLGALTGQQEALLAFNLAASPDQRALVNTGLTGDAMVAAESTANEVVRSAGDQQSATAELAITAEQADRTLGAIVNLVVRTEQKLHEGQVALATELRDAVRQQVLVEAAAVLAVLAVAIIVALLLARLLTRSLGQLREGALSVANRDLPETVARFSDPQNLGESTPAQVASQVRDPIQLRNRDEIGQVAQAFNVVHQAAVRVAAEQAALRTSVSAMFLSLARRSQTLVDRIINELDDIERNEEDPKRLSRLFALDHLATRMRRNDENLLVLAGADSGPTRNEDAAVPDVLRASQSEVEHYARIEFGTVDSDVSVKAGAVNDVVRLVAELFDNATRFSPPNSPVVVEARRLGDQVIVQVEDRGVGMPQDQVNEVNAWLAAPPAVEFTTFRRMGLAVVGRLAARHHMRVELRSDMRSGTVVYVALPPHILVLPQHRSRAAEIPAPRTPAVSEFTEQAPPPLPSRHLGQLPRRSAEVVSHAAGRRNTQNRPPQAVAHTSAADAPQAVAQSRAADAPQAAHTNAADASRRDEPIAGRPPEALLTRVNTSARAAQTARASDATAELPIFREMEAVWFRSHGDLELGATAPAQSAGGGRASASASASASAASHRGTAGQAPPPSSQYAEGGTAGSAATAGGAGEEQWRTAADAGWNAAAAAAQPQPGGATSSGLPKRVPQAQLVPGGVDSPAGSPGTQRRSPEEVRGLLSAYHRGVQRGREHGGR